MRSTTLSLSLTALALSLPISADFFLSNSTICMGAFPVSNCWHGPTVFSGVSNTTAYTCPKLFHAQASVYVWNGTAGPNGSADLYATQPCGVEGEMHFVKDGVTGYKGLNEGGGEGGGLSGGSEFGEALLAVGWGRVF
ncbi:hypothetical protein B0A55_08133 [Friedmanniomyces simplex]|uniref:Uncharacterized protein n=1 Tax=Friedmanniomyces simplex TaxID=329884 RepID=A0A4U0X3W9_9PEZI|nr:hypothetical protein B0A55_08133 [Friedmanniomyces simplex]